MIRLRTVCNDPKFYAILAIIGLGLFGFGFDTPQVLAGGTMLIGAAAGGFFGSTNGSEC
jgi:hypothetical protein